MGPWVAVGLSMAALLMAVPLSVSANLQTPRVRDWWAGSSFRRARRRVCALRLELSYLERSAHDREHLQLVLWRAALRGVAYGVLGLSLM